MQVQILKFTPYLPLASRRIICHQVVPSDVGTDTEESVSCFSVELQYSLALFRPSWY